MDQRQSFKINEDSPLDSNAGREVILVFARLPEVGKCKTRLIPALGPEGAAELHTQMIRHTLKWAAKATDSMCREMHIHVHSSSMTATEPPTSGEATSELTRADATLLLDATSSLAAASQANSPEPHFSGIEKFKDLFAPVWESCPTQWTNGETLPGRAGLAERSPKRKVAVAPQRPGDLGAKLLGALEQFREDGVNRVVVVGTDCPELDEKIAEQAFRRLDHHDVCFAPAYDGGYTLIAVRLDIATAPLKSLFTSIDWGTENVLSQSIAAASHSQLRVALLNPMHDVDLPEDLPWWERAKRFSKVNLLSEVETDWTVNADVDFEVSHRTLDGVNSSCASQSANPPALAIVIPTYGTESRLDEVIASTRQGVAEEHLPEVIVAASGDCSEVLAIAARNQVAFFQHSGTRGHGLNKAIEQVAGRRILMLHADTILPQGYEAAINECLEKPRVVAGAFRLQIESDRKAARWVEWLVSLRSRWWQQPYGDQGIFLDRRWLDDIGGIPDMTIMEDFELVRRLRKKGKIATCDQRVVTSARRWHRLGFLKTTIVNQLMIAGYYLGVAPDRLAQFYRRLK